MSKCSACYVCPWCRNGDQAVRDAEVSTAEMSEEKKRIRVDEAIGPFMARKGDSGNLRLEVFGGDGLDAMVVCSIGKHTIVRQEWSRFLLAEWCRGVLRWLDAAAD